MNKRMLPAVMCMVGLILFFAPPLLYPYVAQPIVRDAVDWDVAEIVCMGITGLLMLVGALTTIVSAMVWYHGR